MTTEIFDLIIDNLINVAYALMLFLCAYVSNMCFSMYLNIKLLKQKFDKNKLLNSLIKAGVFLVGLTLLTIVFTVLPIFAEIMSWDIPQEFIEMFSGIVIIATFLYVTCKYAVEAITKFNAILGYKEEEADEEDSETEDKISYEYAPSAPQYDAVYAPTFEEVES